MILTGNEIAKQTKTGCIHISPFHLKQITTNSYDLTLGDTIIRYTDEILDPAKEPNYTTERIPKEGLTLKKGEFILGHSEETIGSDHFVPIIHAKSGIARLGLFVHVTADLIDIGSIGNVTFQLYATLPVKIYPGMKIGQASFWKPLGQITLYNGKYKGSKGPQPSKIWLDFHKSQRQTMRNH